MTTDTCGPGIFAFTTLFSALLNDVGERNPGLGKQVTQFLLLATTKEICPSQVALVVKNRLANVGNVNDTGSIPGLGRSPEEGNGSSLQHSCLENHMDRGTWWVTVHGVTQSQTQLGGNTFTFKEICNNGCLVYNKKT